MCGICGFYSPEGQLTASSLEAATRCLAHRGPDGIGFWSHPAGVAGFGHTRLAIIDLKTGQQPMSSLDGRFVIVFNGEIYNFRDLRAELESLGHDFRTRSDTEVLLNAYRQWGQDCLIRLNGMFAFAIFDVEQRKLILARDRTGIKPLYYHDGPRGFIFGSELKSLLAWPEVPRRIDFKALTDFVMLTYPIPPATCFRDCRELEPGCFMEVTRSSTSISRYWSWQRDETPLNGDDLVARLGHELRTAISEHLVSDVPVGAFLSGGIDSSLLVALHPAAHGQKLQTFNVKFGERDYDESEYARMVASHAGTQHHEIVLETNSGDLDTVCQVLDQFDQPFGDSSAIPTYIICKEMRRYTKVVIGGDGGDEMFGGYPRFAHADVVRALRLSPRWSVDLAEYVLSKQFGFSDSFRRQGLRLIRAAKRGAGVDLLDLCSIVRPEELSAMFLPGVTNSGDVYIPELSKTGRKHSGGSELIDATVHSTLPGDYLRKVDVMSSAHGLEVRVPLLSNRIIEFARKLPGRMKYSLRANKILLRKLAAAHLPRQVARKRKQGFGIPLDTWISKEGRAMVSDMLLSTSSRLRDLIDSEYLERLARSFEYQEWNPREISRYSIYQRTYCLWSLQRWLQRWRPAI